MLIKVLFVEDREDDMLLVVRALEKDGFEIDYSRVQTEKDLRSKLSNGSWDLVIADFSMPYFSGPEALQVFKEYDLDIPFFLVSGSVGEDIAVQMMKDGASDYVMKDNLVKIPQAVKRELHEAETKRKKKEIEEELKKASIIIASTDVILWQWQPKKGWPVQYVSQNVRQFGYEPEEFTSGKICYDDFLHPDDKAEVFSQSMHNISIDRDLYKQTYRIVAKNGDVRWMDDYTTLIRNENGELLHIQGVTYDITETINMERELKKSETLYKGLVETSPDGICVLDTDFSTTFVNSSKIKLFRYENYEEMIGIKGFDLLSDESRDQVMSNLPKLIEEERITIPDVLFKRKDGTTFWGIMRTVLLKDTDGNPSGYMNLVTDITERKLMEEELKESEERFRSSFENAPIGMDIIAVDGKILKANKAFCELMQYTEDELQKKTFYDFTHPEDIPMNVSVVKDLVEGGSQTVKIQKRYVRKDGEIIWVDVSSTLLRNSNNNPLYFIAQVQDITKSKFYEQEILLAKEKAEESDKLKSSLLTNMSHELRTPLNGIMGFAELLRNNSVNPDMNDMADQILKSGRRLMATLESVMMLAQLESAIKLPKREYDFCNVSSEIQSLILNYADEVQQKGLMLSTTLMPNMYLRVEPKLFRHALAQVIDNAVKFTNRGSISIQTLIEGSGADARFVIRVIDTGIGVSPEKYNLIFKEFRQASEGYGRSYEGIGLGLPITKRILELMGGSITFESAYHVGSTFIVSIPYKKVFEENHKEASDTLIKPVSAPAKTETVQENQGSDRKRILIVEDNPINQKLTTAFLKNKFEVECVFNGETSIQRCSENQYDLILMDINLGSGMDGLEASRVIRSLPNYENVPVVAITGYTLIGDKERILNEGCTHYLGKPFSKEQLYSAIREALNIDI